MNKDEIKELISMSVVDNSISEAKRDFIYRKAQDAGMEKTEVDILIDYEVSQKYSTANTTIENHSDQRKGVRTDSLGVNFTQKSKWPLIIAAFAFICTFLPWFSYSVESSYSSNYGSGNYSTGDLSIFGWYHGYGLSALFIFSIAIFLYLKNKSYWWLGGIAGIINAIVILIILSNSNTAISSGNQYGQVAASAGITPTYGFYLFILASFLFSLLRIPQLRFKNIPDFWRNNKKEMLLWLGSTIIVYMLLSVLVRTIWFSNLFWFVIINLVIVHLAMLFSKRESSIFITISIFSGIIFLGGLIIEPHSISFGGVLRVFTILGCMPILYYFLFIDRRLLKLYNEKVFRRK